MLYRVAGAAEPATYTFAMSGSTKSAGGLITISGANASPLDATGAAASSWTAPSVTTLTNGAIVVGCWANVASASTPPATMTERFDLPYSDKIVGACSTELRPTAGATGTRTATGTGIDPSSRLVAFKP
jgi:hypothetical protein